MIFTVIDAATGLEVVNLEQLALDAEWADKLVYCDITGWAVTEDGCLFLMDDCGNVAFPPEGRFKVVFTNDLAHR